MQINKEQFNISFLVPVFALSGLFIAGLLHFTKYEDYDHQVLLITVALGTLPLLWRIITDIYRKKFGIDIIAIVAIITSFILREYAAGAVILLMLSGGEALEAYALGRARRELKALLSRVPSVAHKKLGEDIINIPVLEIQAGDTLLIKPGETVPTDSIVVDGRSEVDEAAITGESIPVQKSASSHLYSGSINKDGALVVQALKPAKESTYEKIVQLVREAENSRAPIVRLADRYSIGFTIVTFVIALAAWAISKDPVRVLAVLVVATPCPLILATPIAIMSGVSRAASRGIIVKNGGALEKLAEVKAFIFDKTGTLTLGTPLVAGVAAFGELSKDEILRLAASLDQFSDHILARSLTEHVKKEKNISLLSPKNFKEIFGDGVEGELDGKKYLFGKLDFLRQNNIVIQDSVNSSHQSFHQQGQIAVYLGSEGKLLGAVQFADSVRPETKNLFRDMAKGGMEKIVMLTGDKKGVAEKIGEQLGITDIHAECLPQDKVREVQEHKKEFGSVAMVGDGINDAPALAVADVGIAIGAHGNTASSETGDIVITVDNLSRVGTAHTIAKHTLRIAKQSIFIGIGVSIALMIVASLGYIKPVYGALLQQVLDIFVILNALRVSFVKIE